MMGMDVLLGNGNPQNDRIYGVTIAIVTNNKDPDKLGRVKVKFPWLSDTDESDWARVLSPMAGKQRGLYLLPEVGDEVLVAFEQGDPQFPYVLGALWNGQDKPPGTNEDGKNNQRLFKSRSGHTILFDDTQGEEKIVIQDKTNNNEISIDSKNNVIVIKSEKDVAIEAKGNISLSTNSGNVAIECSKFSVDAQQGIEIKTSATCDIAANTSIGIKCLAGVKINDGALEVT
ncbi:phage baseplate assembly protein V [Leptolyngbya sp. DQ-M1]|uniref:phage baseplate assembly protein V n=1 Tax=Leptolyngbya sp. DQ-M1 TaxID=2933920 RepID=UPI003298D832